MIEAFWYLAIGATIIGLLVGREWSENPVGYAVAVTLWPFLAITVAASMARAAFLGQYTEALAVIPTQGGEGHDTEGKG